MLYFDLFVVYLVFEVFVYVVVFYQGDGLAILIRFAYIVFVVGFFFFLVNVLKFVSDVV